MSKFTRKFTPGPWKVIASRVDAYTYYFVGGTPGLHMDQREANAKLIAAAPELLEAAKEAREYLLAEGHQEGYNKTLDMICAVIAKAEGSGNE